VGVVAGIIIPRPGIRRKRPQNWSCRNFASSAGSILNIKRSRIKIKTQDLAWHCAEVQGGLKGTVS